MSGKGTPRVMYRTSDVSRGFDFVETRAFMEYYIGRFAAAHMVFFYSGCSLDEHPVIVPQGRTGTGVYKIRGQYGMDLRLAIPTGSLLQKL